MGSCFGKFSVPFIHNEEHPGQGKAAREVFGNIKLSQQHLNALYTAFDDIDSDGSGVIRMDEFFSFFKLEPSEFSKEIFRIFDCDGNGQLTFLEFVCVVWNFLTLRHTLIGHYVVFIYCGSVSGNNYISLNEILSMIMLVQGRSNFDNNVHIQEAISSLKKEKKGMTVHELVQWMHDHPMVTNPVLHLYSNLRNALLGARFWNQLSKIRYAHDYMKPIVYVIDLAEHLEAEELTRLEQEAVDSAALSNMSRQKRGRRGSLLELSRSGKLPAPSVPAEDIVTQLDYDIAITGASTFEDEYRPDLRRKKPETVPKRPKVITKKPRRQSLSKALSFVKGIGSSKSNNKKTDSVTPETTQKDRRHIISIKLAIDVIKSVASGSGKNNDNKSKKKKQKKNKIDAEPMNLERTACTTQTVGWKSAEKYQQY